MLTGFDQLMEKVRTGNPVTVSVAVAQDLEVLKAVGDARREGLAEAILVGDEGKIAPLLAEAGLPRDQRIVHEEDPERAALAAARLVRMGEADILMKGNVNSSTFLKATLDVESGLRSGGILCHLAAFEIPGERRIKFVTDGGMNILPDLDQKRQILIVAIEALHAAGIACPNVALLAASEQVTSKMPGNVDARALVEMWERGKFPKSIVEGPIALDVAVEPEAAGHKGIRSSISGAVDLFLVPNIEAGNLLGKSLIYYGHAKMAGVILGATHPIVLTSRSDTTGAKLRSLALAALLSAGNKNLGPLKMPPAACAEEEGARETR
jgi:phosphate butyryltransferase